MTQHYLFIYFLFGHILPYKNTFMKIMMERKIVMVLNMVLLIKYLIFFYLLVLMVPIKI
jgi:hypothetical protein